MERSNNSALIFRGVITCFIFSYKDFNSVHMVLCLKSEQCSHVVAQLSPVCDATSIAFIFYNIAFDCVLYYAEQPL